MRLKIFIVAVFQILCLQYSLIGQETDETFSIYLVRHAEKELSSEDPKDPPLTSCGGQRAASLANFFSDVDLDAIYSTNYIRTKSTAHPTAEDKEEEIKFYDPRKLEEFAELLIKNKQDVLVVGHSNTTGALAGLLAGESLGSFDESIYNRIYQVVVYKEKGRLHLLHSQFSCQN